MVFPNWVVPTTFLMEERRGHLKSIVYDNGPILSEQDLIGRISAAAVEIKAENIYAANKSTIK